MDLDKIIGQIRAKLPYTRLVGIDARIRWGIVAAVPLAIFALIFFLLITPKSVQVEDLNNQLVQARMEVQKKQALERRLPEFEMEIKRKDYELTLLRRQLPEEKEIPDLIDQVSNLGTQSGLQFLTFKPKQEQIKDFYAEVPVELKIQGKFHNLVAFFDRISRLPRIVTISNLSIVQSKVAEKKGQAKGSGKLIEAKCNAITFRFIEARVDEPVEEKGKGKGKK
jgi:type IV pilus assembly protein PilO